MAKGKTLQCLGVQERTVEIRGKQVRFQGFLQWPQDPQGIILFVQGSGDGWFRPGNPLVTRLLGKNRFATLFIDPLKEQESQVFDFSLLVARIHATKDWLLEEPDTSFLPLGYFGFNAGAGAVLQAAALWPVNVAAVVACSGRPDLAKRYLAKVKAPTLLIAGSHDGQILQINQDALALLTCPRELVIVPGASHLFEQPGALDEVAQIVSQWFPRYFSKPEAPLRLNS